MSQAVCDSCRKPKAGLKCDLCEANLCKNCVQRVDENTFAFLAKIPEPLSHHLYCGPCFDENVAGELERYQEIMARAKNVFVFFKTRKKGIPLISKEKDVLKVEDCPDRDETILRLAFFAAEKNCNAVVEVDVQSEKIWNNSYQTSRWKGSGVAAQVNEDKLDKQELQDQIYR